MLRTLSPTPSISTRARRSFRTEFGPERLEDRCLLTNNVAGAIPLGALPADGSIVKNGTISSEFNDADLYSFKVAQGQNVSVTIDYAGDSTTSHGQDPYTLGLYYAGTAYQGKGAAFPYYLDVLESDTSGDIFEPRPTDLVDGASYISYRFDGRYGDLNADSSLNGLYYLYVDTSGWPLGLPGYINTPLTGALDTPANYTVPGAYTLTVSTTNSTTTVENPTAVNQTATTTENQPVNIDVLTGDTDPNGYPLTITGVASGGTANQSAQGGQLSTSQGVVTYTPPTGYTGPDSFAYTISDGHGGMASATVTITVSPPVLPAVSFLSAQENVIIKPGSGQKSTTETIYVGIPEATTVPVQVSYAYDADASTAIPGKNFTGQTSDTLTIPVGATLASFVIVIPNTAVNGGPKVATFTLKDASNAMLGAVLQTAVDIERASLGRKAMLKLYNAEKLVAQAFANDAAAGVLNVKLINVEIQIMKGLEDRAEIEDLIYGGDPKFDDTFNAFEALYNSTISQMNQSLAAITAENSIFAYFAQITALDQRLANAAQNSRDVVNTFAADKNAAALNISNAEHAVVYAQDFPELVKANLKLAAVKASAATTIAGDVAKIQLSIDAARSLLGKLGSQVSAAEDAVVQILKGNASNALIRAAASTFQQSVDHLTSTGQDLDSANRQAAFILSGADTLRLGL